MLKMNDFLEVLKKKYPQELVVIDDKINPAEFEATAILQHLENAGKYPAVLFTKPLNLKGEVSKFPLLINAVANREKFAISLGVDPSQCKLPLALLYSERELGRVKPVIIPKKEAPVKEVIKLGQEADLREFPIVKHHYMDPAPFLTMIPIHRDLESGAYNAAFLRMQYKGPRRLGLYMGPRNNWEIVRRHDVKNLDTPTVIVVTHHPAWEMGTLNVAPFGTNDYELIGSIMGEPVRLTPSETWGEDFMVPADADILIEGNTLANTREAEGPFGEYTGYFGPQRYSNIIDVTAITYCRNAVYQDAFVGHAENWIMGSVPKEGSIYQKIKAVVPNVKGVHFANSGCGRHNVYIAIEQTVEGQAKQAALVAMGNMELSKHIVVVDSDIDPYNETEVLWAIATRVQPDEDVEIIHNIKGGNLDPSVRGDLLSSKMIIDATKPTGRPFEERIRIPAEAM
ncbi:MAG: UbiD family decarboxylase, partial [Chloroflexota bacterium]|nr:UbiD family decarboxylase [Chloroflexota bacterium]